MVQEAPHSTQPPDALRPHKRCLTTGSLQKKCPVSLRGARGFSPPAGNLHRATWSSEPGAWAALVPGASFGSTHAPPFPSNGAWPLVWVGPSPGFPLPWHSSPQPVLHSCLAPQAVPTCQPQSSPQDSPLEPESQHPARLRISGWGVPASGSDAALTLLCLPQSSCCAFRGDFEIPPSQLISLSVSCLPRRWDPFLLQSSLSGMLVPP